MRLSSPCTKPVLESTIVIIIIVIIVIIIIVVNVIIILRAAEDQLSDASVQAYQARMTSSPPPHSGLHPATRSLLLNLLPKLRCAPATDRD